MKTLAITAVSLSFTLVAACAATGTHKQISVGPLAATSQTTSVSSAFAPTSTGADEENGAVGAGAPMYLERALDALRDSQPSYASAALHAALSTGELNDAGRALAYWYIYVAETMQGQAQSGHDALADFVAIADSVLTTRAQVRFAESGGTDFVDRFDLVGRLARGRALLNLAWAKSHTAFGRSADAPVPVRSEEEMAYFVELTPACSHPLERKTSQMRAVSGTYSSSLQQVEFRCGNHLSDTTYFFEWRGQQASRSTVTSSAPAPSSAPRRAMPLRKSGRRASAAPSYPHHQY